MKKVLLPLSFAIAFISLNLGEVKAQVCVPDSQYTQAGIYPDTLTGLKDGIQCVYYEELLTLVVPADTFVSLINETCTINSVELISISGLPPGLSYACEPTSCLFPGGTNGCGLIFGVPTDTGSYPLIATTTTIVSGPGLCASVNPILANQELTGYVINIVSPLTGTVTNASCAGLCDGTATVSHTGLTSPITYLWDDPAGQTTAAATGLCGGTHTVTVTDSAGCNLMLEVTVANGAGVSSTASSTTASCGLPNGTATASPTGGSTPYSYLWSSGDSSITAVALASGTYSVTVTDASGCTDSASVSVAAVTPMVLTYTATFSSCGNSDGTATVSVASGTTPYIYSWNTTPAQTNNSATGLASGTYTATITDGLGCVDSILTTVSDAGGLSVVQSGVSMVICNGDCDGMVTATATGAVGSVTYSWNTTPVQTSASATGLCAGTYMATVSDSLCTASLNVTITEPSALVISSEVATNPSCNSAGDESLVITASGGTGTLTYSIDGGVTFVGSGTFTGMGSGVYDVEVMDSVGCTISSAAYTITDPPAIVIVSEVVTNISCNGAIDGSIVITASGGTGPLAYSINGGATYPSTTGSFTGLAAVLNVISVQDSNGCSVGGSSVTITEPTVLTTSSTSTMDSGAGDGTATTTPTGGTSPYMYSWNTTPAQTGATAVGLITGDYVVSVTDTNGCMISDSVNVGFGIGINDLANNLVVKMYPNPAQNDLTIVLNLNYDFTFVAYDVRGKQVLAETMTGGENVLALSDLSTGLYVYHILDNSGAALNHGKFNVVR